MAILKLGLIKMTLVMTVFLNIHAHSSSKQRATREKLAFFFNLHKGLKINFHTKHCLKKNTWTPVVSLNHNGSNTSLVPRIDYKKASQVTGTSCYIYSVITRWSVEQQPGVLPQAYCSARNKSQMVADANKCTCLTSLCERAIMGRFYYRIALHKNSCENF